MPAKLAAALLRTCLCVAPWLFLLATGLFRAGNWYLAEPATIGLHAFSLTLDSCLLALLLSGDKNARAALGNRMLLGCLTLGIVSVCLSPFAVSPVLSLLGLPETGLGALWFFDLAAFMAAGAYCLRTGRFRLPAWSCAWAAVGLAVSAIPTDFVEGVSPLALPQFAAFAVVAAAISLRRLLPLSPGRADAYLAGAVGVLLFLVWNKTAMAFLAVFSLLAWLARDRGREELLGGVRLSLAGAAVPLAGALVIALLAWFRLLPESEGHSLYARFEVYRVVAQALFSHPGRLLAGYGWGSFPHVLVAHGNSASGTLAGITDYGVLVWEGLREPYCQTFNLFLESVMALGVTGLAFWGFVAMLPTGCSVRRGAALAPYYLTLVMLWVTWFDVALLAPFLGLALACFSGGRPTPWVGRPVMASVLVGAMCLQFLGIHRTVGDLESFENEVTEIRSAGPDVLRDLCRLQFPLDGRGDYYEAALLDKASRQVLVDPGMATAYLTRMCRVRGRLAEGARSLPLVYAYLRSLGRMAFELDLPQWAGPRAFHLKDFQAVTSRLLELAPARSDLAVAYLTWAEDKDPAGFQAVLRRMLAEAPSDPVACYFKGSWLALRQGDPGRAKVWLDKALKGGVRRILIPDEALVKLVESGG